MLFSWMSSQPLGLFLPKPRSRRGTAQWCRVFCTWGPSGAVKGRFWKLNQQEVSEGHAKLPSPRRSVQSHELRSSRQSGTVFPYSSISKGAVLAHLAPTPPRVACEGLAWKQYASRHTSDFERQAPRAFKSNSLLFFFGLAIGSTISVPRTYLMLALLASDGASGPVAL